MFSIYANLPCKYFLITKRIISFIVKNVKTCGVRLIYSNLCVRRAATKGCPKMLKEIIEDLRQFDGIRRKKDIKIVSEVLKGAFWPDDVVIGLGDDAGVIKSKSDDEYLLLACDGIHPYLVKNEPYAAGKASVMVNVSDIYAMGGTPIAAVNVISYRSEDVLRKIIEGMKNASLKFRVPMIGGHIHPGADEDAVSVAILGRATKFITSFGANPGDDIILAVDLNGKQGCKSVSSWDSNSGKESAVVLSQLGVMNQLAEKGIVTAAKDVSMGGIAGTIAMLLESSKKGGIIYLDRIPAPQDMEFNKWIKSFLSYGFIISCLPSNSDRVISMFNTVGITATTIGNIDDSKQFVLNWHGEKELLFDFNKDYIACP